MRITHQEDLQGRGDELDSFVVDIERLCHGTDKNISPNLRIADIHRLSQGTDRETSANSMIARSFSRKGSNRGERKSNATTAASNDKATDTAAAANGDISSKGSGGGESITAPMGTASVEAMNKQTQVMMMMMNSENRGINSPRRRNGTKRASVAWLIGPRTVLAAFATLSSMGTMLLIYFTLSIGKLGEDDLSQALLQ